MAVPKKKTSKSKSGLRRTHKVLKKINVVTCPESGDLKLPHRATAAGMYKGRELFAKAAD